MTIKSLKAKLIKKTAEIANLQLEYELLHAEFKRALEAGGWRTTDNIAYKDKKTPKKQVKPTASKQRPIKDIRTKSKLTAKTSKPTKATVSKAKKPVKVEHKDTNAKKAVQISPSHNHAFKEIE